MSKIYKVIMNHVTTTGENEIILKKVKGEPFSLDSSLFVRYVKGVYHLTDIATGCELTHSSYYDVIEYWYKQYKDKLEVFRLTDSYKNKLKKFKQLEELQ